MDTMITTEKSYSNKDYANTYNCRILLSWRFIAMVGHLFSLIKITSWTRFASTTINVSKDLVCQRFANTKTASNV